MRSIEDSINLAQSEWEAERSKLEQLRTAQEDLDRVRTQIEAAERDYDLNKAAELRYGQLPKLEEQLRDLTQKARERQIRAFGSR